VDDAGTVGGGVAGPGWAEVPSMSAMWRCEYVEQRKHRFLTFEGQGKALDAGD